jgi:hypothetical protein
MQRIEREPKITYWILSPEDRDKWEAGSYQSSDSLWESIDDGEFSGGAEQRLALQQGLASCEYVSHIRHSM